MNDFTKEELLLLLLSYWPSPYCIDRDKDLLLNKLQSMIENYCEHKGFIGTHQWKTCNDCGQPFCG